MKRILAIVLCLSLLLAGCGSGAQTAQQTTAPQTTGAGTAADASEELPNLVMNFAYLEVPTDLKMIEEEINKITVEKIGCTVTLNAYTYGNIQDQMTMILSSPSEQWDLMCGLFRSGITGNVSKGQLTPLNDLLDQYGQDIVEVLGQGYLDACSVDGECYEVTTCRNLAMQECVLFDKAIIDELNLNDQVAACTTYSDLTPIFAAIHEAHPEIYVAASSGIKPNLIITGIDGQDILSDSLGVLMDATKPVVSNLFESEEYKQLCQLARSWNEAGYIYPDITTDDSNNGQSLLKNGLLAAYFQTYKPGAVVENQNACGGKELVCALVNKPLATNVQNWGWAIPTNAKYPEKAMQLLNLLFSDPDLINLLSYGVEGYHWVRDAEGFACPGEHSDGYADKKNWISGNAYIGAVWTGDDADLFDQLKDFNNNATKSVAMGFAFDGSALNAEYTAMQNVISKYRMMLEWGFYSDVDAALEQFNSDLYDAGLQKYMDAKQEQLNEFVK